MGAGRSRSRSRRRADDVAEQRIRPPVCSPQNILDGCRSAMVWDAIDLTSETRSKRRGDAEWRLPRPAKIYGFATWWKVELVPGIAIFDGTSVAPDPLGAALFSPACADRGQPERPDLDRSPVEFF